MISNILLTNSTRENDKLELRILERFRQIFKLVTPFSHSLNWHQRISIDYGQGWQNIRKKTAVHVNENSEPVILSVGRNLAQF